MPMSATMGRITGNWNMAKSLHKWPFFPTFDEFFSGSQWIKLKNIFFPAYTNQNGSLKTKINKISVGDFHCRRLTLCSVCVCCALHTTKHRKATYQKHIPNIAGQESYAWTTHPRFRTRVLVMAVNGDFIWCFSFRI